MSEEEKAALAWLDRIVSLDGQGRAHEGPRRTLKSMLARPVLPEVPDIATLEAMSSSWARDIYDRLYAHLTKPKTKTVWTVHVSHGPNDSGGTLHSEDEAIEQARGFLSLPGATVTISTREVPQ